MIVIRREAAAVELWVHVTTRAPREAVGGTRGDALVVRVCAAPSDGRANDAVCRLLARQLGLRPRQVELVTGQRSRRKRLRVEGEPDRLATALEGLAADPRAFDRRPPLT